MKKIIVTSLVSFSFVFILSQCTTDENNPVGGNDPVVDPITNQWTDTSDTEHRFTFTTFDSTVTRGIFFGDEDHPEIGNSQLFGFFDRSYVEFDVLRPLGRLKFTGNFVNNNQINLQSSEGSIVIRR
jgi:hypothetical protein